MTKRRPPALTRPGLPRIVGLLYLLIAVAGGFAQIVRSSMIERGDAAATAANILVAERLYRFGLSSDLVVFATEAVLALVVYAWLRPVNANLALLAAFLRLVQAAVLSINMLNQFAALLVLRAGGGASGLDDAQAHAMAQLLLDTHRYGYLIGLIFFGLQNIVLGYLLITSGFAPRIIGILLMTVVSMGYLVDSFGQFLVPDFPGVISVVALTPAVISEITFIAWLLIKGASVSRLSAPASLAA